MSHPPFDLAHVEAQWGDPADETYRMILGIFTDECDELCGKARSALVEGRPGDLARIAHTLRGASANVGALHLGQTAGALEAAAAAGEMGSLPALLESMETAAGVVRDVIAAGGPNFDGA